MIKGNKIFIGEMINSQNAIKIQGSGIEDNEIRIHKMLGSKDAISITPYESINASLGLPKDTPMELLKEALRSLNDIAELSPSEKEDFIKTTNIWEWISRTSDTSAVIANMVAATPYLLPFLSGLI